MVLDEIRPLLDVLPLAAVVVSADTRRVIRDAEEQRAALLAYASRAEHEAIVRAGFHLHLRKPIEPVEFARCLKRVGRRALSTSQP